MLYGVWERYLYSKKSFYNLDLGLSVCFHKKINGPKDEIYRQVVFERLFQGVQYLFEFVFHFPFGNSEARCNFQETPLFCAISDEDFAH